MNSEIRHFRRVLRVLERALQKQLQEDCECCGVSAVECHTLLELQEAGTTTNGKLARQLDLDKSTVSRGIDDLVSKGLVDRKRNPRNRRTLDLSLTPEGEGVCRSVHQSCEAYYGRLLAGIPGSDRQTVVNALRTFAEAAGGSGKQVDKRIRKQPEDRLPERKEKDAG